MALVKGYHVTYRWQGISLHCWLTAIEMLMDWRYGNIFGVNPVTNLPRTQHTEQVLQAKARNAPDQTPHIFGRWFKAGYSPDQVNDYGIRRAPGGDVDDTVESWITKLRAGGPMLACGEYGPARMFPGSHVVLIVGVSGSNKIVYLDPFLIGMKAIVGNHHQYMSPADALKRLSETFNMQNLFQAATGAADPGFGW